MKYAFKPVSKPLLTVWTIEKIMDAHASGLRELNVTLDLGLSQETIKITSGSVIIRGIKVDLNVLGSVSDDSVYYVSEDGMLFKIAFYRGGSYYRLKAVAEDTAPTLEINGIHMHRVKDVTPIVDTLLKVKAASVRKCSRVLDICTGLGYTAIMSVKKGACSVISVEKDPNVLKIAEHNPWSRDLVDSRIEVYLADAVSFVKNLPSKHFDRIIHDPPRFSLAGELYSRSFYLELFRVLKTGGILFHYTGEPGRVRGKSIIQGISRRLQETGFTVRRSRRAQGLVAYKY